MPMSKQRRDELRAALDLRARLRSRMTPGPQTNAPIFDDELRELLDGVERLEHSKKWLVKYAQPRLGDTLWNDGFRSCARQALNEIESPLPQGEPES